MKSKLIILTITSLALMSCGENGDPLPEEGGVAAAPDAYPLDTCVVSGEKLGSMGEPVVLQHEGTTVKFCCNECLPQFNKDPGKFVALVRKAAEGN